VDDARQRSGRDDQRGGAPSGGFTPFATSALGSGGHSFIDPVGPQQINPSNPASAAASAYELFKKSTGYTSRFDEGLRAVSSNYFGGGVGQSGAAVKAALRYGQDFASREFGNWMGALGNQQGLGFAGQAAIARAQNSGAALTGLAGIAGNAVGALSSYRQPSAPVYPGPFTTGPVINNYGYG
jgi:hypothetical protein